MRRSFAIVLGLFLGVVLSLSLATSAAAQGKKEKKAKEDRLSGAVHMINKDTSTITLRTRGGVQRQVVYGPDTKFTYRNQAGSLDEVKENRRVICLGKYDEKARLMATRIDIREGR